MSSYDTCFSYYLEQYMLKNLHCGYGKCTSAQISSSLCDKIFTYFGKINAHRRDYIPITNVTQTLFNESSANYLSLDIKTTFHISEV